ncbi:MAG: hypothetical protein DRN37_01150 [Thermoplasmata archaeon]|nr:MAG: hypothetical protein DRG82_11970 [Deltaproteobacteria bacterium]RLF61361.1 MAG: hypothetical protein DRN37_01150 [Thermoplasmata archaeon]
MTYNILLFISERFCSLVFTTPGSSRLVPFLTLFTCILVHFGTSVLLHFISSACQEKMCEEFQDFSATGTSFSNLLEIGGERSVSTALLFHAVNNRIPSFSLRFRVKES